ncbi:unnamed protein product [Cuscuta epithymum]|uniref:Uncharacterized protein n=1 Tax=Cuscuta epithymum TaxID=186058 RepID=A0AAV0EIK8_9ASTE|nr:unnamed protein product [Cuscuta epithymum]CAH9131485.1 unnamed protein product [Cuscuta epithymum]
MERWSKENIESSLSSDSVSDSHSPVSKGIPARYGSSMNLMEEKKKKLQSKKKKKVFVEGYAKRGAAASVVEEDDELGRSKSLTDDDLEELKGCLDLGFGFNYEEIPELCNTLPALELCYSMTQKYLLQDDHHHSAAAAAAAHPASPSSSATSPIANWKISSPGDDPEEVKARLKYWAQATVCTVKLCSTQKRNQC